MKYWALLLVLVLVAAHQANASYCLAAQSGDGDSCFPLVSAQGATVGNVCFSGMQADARAAQLVVSTDHGWSLGAADVWVGLSINDAPRSPSGQPLSAQFPQHCSSSNPMTTSCTTTFSLVDIYSLEALADNANLPCNKPLYFSVRSNVVKYEAGVAVATAVAWTNGFRFNARGANSKATYNEVEVLCGEDC